MIVRALTSTGDWTFGAGISNYKTANSCIAQNIQTRLSSWLGNCFFDVTSGIDWLNFLSGSRNQLLLQLALQTVILNTTGVLGIQQLSFTLNRITRAFSITFQVQTIYSTTGGSFIYSLGGTNNA